MHTSASLFQKDSSFVSRRIADEVILVPIRNTGKDVESIYTLNTVAARVWDLIDGARRVEEIRDQIVTEFEVSQVEAERDLLILLHQFNEIGAINKVPANVA